MHNISTECLFSFITNPPGGSTGIPPEIHPKSARNPPEMIPEKGRNLLSFGVRSHKKRHIKLLIPCPIGTPSKCFAKI